MLLVVQLFCACVLLLVCVYGWFAITGVGAVVCLYGCLVSYCFVLASIDVCGYC